MKTVGSGGRSGWTNKTRTGASDSKAMEALELGPNAGVSSLSGPGDVSTLSSPPGTRFCC